MQTRCKGGHLNGDWGREAKQENRSKQQAGYQEKNRITKHNEGTLGGKADPQLGSVYSS